MKALIKTGISTAVMTVFMTMNMASQAADSLHNTQWKTIDDKTGKPKAIIKIVEQKGLLVGRIQTMLGKSKDYKCNVCKGKFKDKSLIGAPIFWNLKKSGDEYTGGVIFDPKKGKSYKLKGKLAQNGKVLEMRGYVGSPLLGRTQTWQRVK